MPAPDIAPTLPRTARASPPPCADHAARTAASCAETQPAEGEALWARVGSAITAELDSPELAAEVQRRAEARAANRRDWARDADGYRAHLARLDRVEAGLLGRYRRGAIDFGKVSQIRIQADTHPQIAAWHARVSQRPSAKA
jgi:glutathione S-transferase